MHNYKCMLRTVCSMRQRLIDVCNSCNYNFDSARLWVFPSCHHSWIRVFSHESKFEIAMTNCNCDIWITECTHEREKTSLSLRFSIPERGEEARLVSVFWWHADCYFISTRKCAVYRRKWLEGHVHVAPPPKSQFSSQGIHIQRFCFMIWEMRHWKTPPDHHLNCAIYAKLCTHGPKYHHSNDHSNCALCSRVKAFVDFPPFSFFFFLPSQLNKSTSSSYWRLNFLP